jgi:hypothetical protein
MAACSHNWRMMVLLEVARKEKGSDRLRVLLLLPQLSLHPHLSMLRAKSGQVWTYHTGGRLPYLVEAVFHTMYNYAFHLPATISANILG